MTKKDVTKKDNQEKVAEFLSVSDAAEITGYSRQHIVRLINAEKIPAKRVGRSFVIERKYLPGPLSSMSEKEEREIEKAVSRVFQKYEEALRKLSKE